MPDPCPRIDINHEQVQRRTTKAINQRQSLIQVQELYKKNSGGKSAPTAQEVSELSFQFAEDGTDTGELLAAVPDMVDDNLDTADDVVLDPCVLAMTDSEEVSTDVRVDTTEEELLENDYELLRSLQDDILTLKVEASQEGEQYLEQKEMEKARQLSKNRNMTLRNQLVDLPRERSLVMTMILLIHQITILRTMIQMMKKNMKTMNTTKTTAWTMLMTLVNCQPLDLQDQEWHGHHPLIVVRIRKRNAPE